MQGLKIRRALMVSALCLTMPGVALVQAREELGRTLLERTQGMFDLAPHWQPTRPRVLSLNGARVIVATGSSEQPLTVMLDHFQGRCRAASGGLHEAAKRAFEPARGDLPSLVDGVLRVEDEHQGMVACLGLGEAQLTADELLSRLDRFADNADLSELGGIRVVRVQSQGEGSFFVAAWSDGSMSLTRMFPAEGDSPGVDPLGMPRPNGATRFLSAWQEGAPTAIHLYLSSTQRDEAFAEYTRDLERVGWAAADASTLYGGAPANGAMFARGAQTVVVHAQSNGPATVISVLPMELRAEREVMTDIP